MSLVKRVKKVKMKKIWHQLGWHQSWTCRRQQPWSQARSEAFRAERDEQPQVAGKHVFKDQDHDIMISWKENDPGSWEGQTASGRFLKSSLKSEQKEVGVEVEIEIRMKIFTTLVLSRRCGSMLFSFTNTFAPQVLRRGTCLAACQAQRLPATASFRGFEVFLVEQQRCLQVLSCTDF